MRIASHFQRRRWIGLRPVRLVPARVLAGLLLFGCFFELDELVEGVGGFGNAGAVGPGGGGAIAQGGSLNGGSGGGSGAPTNGCAAGQKRCGEICVPMTVENGCGNSTCAPCAQPAQGSVICSQDTGLCQVDSCSSGYADCDGNLLAYDGDDAGNGCEYSFGDIRDVTQPLVVPFVANTITLEDQGRRDDWTGIPSYPLEATCQDCKEEQFPVVIAQSEAPPKRDLDAYVRVAWNSSFLYVLGEAFDNTLFHRGVEVGGQCQNGAPCEDSFTVFFDGRNDRDVIKFSGNDDFHVFLGLSGEAFRTSAGAVSDANVAFVPTVQGSSCYRIEAQISWSHIVDLQGSGASQIPNIFPPKRGQRYGFDVSVNDWEPAVSDGPPQRQSQLFYATPSELYFREATGYIPIVLSGGPGADAGP